MTGFVATLLAILTVARPCLAQQEVQKDRPTYAAHQADQLIQIDGDLSDWWPQRPDLMSLVGHQHRENLNSPESLESMEPILLALWDANYLYIAAEVRDQTHHAAEQPRRLFTADSIQLAFDPRDNALVQPGYDDDDVELGFADSIEAGAMSYVWTPGLRAEDSADQIKVVYQPWRDGGGGTYEAAIPWSYLQPFEPKAGARFGFNALVNENDGAGRAGWSAWRPGLGTGKNPWQFGRIALREAASDNPEPELALIKPYFGVDEPLHYFGYLLWPEARTSPFTGTATLSHKGRAIDTQSLEGELAQGINRIELTHPPQYQIDTAQASVELSTSSGQVLEFAPHRVRWISPGVVLERADRLAQTVDHLKKKTTQAQDAGAPVAYPETAIALAELFIHYGRRDIRDPETLKKYQPLGEIVEQFAYLERSLKLASMELERIIADPSTGRDVPRPNLMSLSIQRGEFVTDMGEPVMLVGPLGWDPIFEDLAYIQKLGFNFASSTIEAPAVTPRPGAINDWLKAGRESKRWLRTISEGMDKAERLNIAMDFLPSPHPVGKGWHEAYPNLDEHGTNAFIDASFYHPAFWDMVEEFWAAVVPAVRDKPALLAWDMVNEWTFREGLSKVGPQMLALFHAELRGKYDQIEKLNEVWGTDHTSFEEIDPHQIFRPANPAGYYDWEAFRESEGLRVIKRLQATLRRFDPATPTHVKTMGTKFFGGNEALGADREAMDDVTNISGLDASGPMHYNLVRSLHPSHPVVESEEHVSPNTTAEHMRLSLWHDFLQGLSGRLYYAWARSYVGTVPHSGAILHNPAALEAAARTTLDLRRLGPEVARVHRSIEDAEVAILYSPASRILEPEYTTVTQRVFSAVKDLDAPVRFVSERQIQTGELAGIRLLLVMGAPAIHQATADRIAEFAREGGLVLATPDAMRRTPSDQALRIQSHGGRIRALAIQGQDASTVASTLDRAINLAGISRPIRLLTIEGDRPSNIEFRALRENEGWLFYAINFGEPTTVLLDTSLSLRDGYDLIQQQALEDPILLPANEPKLFRFTGEGADSNGPAATSELSPIGAAWSPSLKPLSTTKSAGPLPQPDEFEYSELPHHIKLRGSDDPHAVLGTAKHRSEPGIYVWWTMQRDLPPGRYHVRARVRAVAPSMFTLHVVNASSDESREQIQRRIDHQTYEVIDIGTFEYDGSFNLRLSDYSDAGLWIDFLYLVPAD